jgi:protein-S-isoprenylcysteine O-methyltransferase Ste14
MRGLTKAGGARMITVLLTLALTAAIYFFAAGTFRLSRAWLYYGGLLAYLVLALAAFFLFFPDAIATINARGKLHRDVKAWDKLFGLAYTALLLVQPAIAGWDVRAHRAVTVPWLVAAAALTATLVAYAFVHWAMIVNRHAETGVRIQDDRQHAVISAGPYRIVRHPFYIALIVTQLVYPLALGSPSASVPSLVMAALFVWRTAREDATLRRELAGYEAFAQSTRYRLLPGVW